MTVQFHCHEQKSAECCRPSVETGFPPREDNILQIFVQFPLKEDNILQIFVPG